MDFLIITTTCLEPKTEKSINQLECSGTSGGKAPFISETHVARCGFINMFEFHSEPCEINYFATTETPFPGLDKY